MLADLDYVDAAILGSAVLLSGRIAWLDFRWGRFPLSLWGALTVLGLVWCLKQEFWPAALIPLALGVVILWGMNRFIKEVIGEGDLLLFLTTGLFIPLYELDRFFILAGLSGVVLGLVTKFYPRRNVPDDIPCYAFPFSGALLAAMLLTLGITLWF